MARKCRSVFPSVETIATYTKCSISTVVRATNYFQRMGWVCKIKRCYRSNTYFMCDKLMKLNLNDPNTFRPILFDENDSTNDNIVLCNKFHESTSTVHKEQNSKKALNSVKKPFIPPFLRNIGLSYNDQLRLIRTFNENQLAKAVLEDMPWYISMGNKVKCVISYIWSRAKYS